MSRFCPHCRFPFDPDWGDDPLPTLCPRCGQRLAATSANNPRSGIASFLHKPVEPEVEVELLRPQLPARTEPSASEDTLSTARASLHAASDSSGATDNSEDATEQAELVSTSAITLRSTSPRLDIAPARVSATPAPAQDTTASAVTASSTDSSPTFVRSTAAPTLSRRAVIVQSAIVAVLLLVLALQLLLADRERLAKDAQWRPMLQGICSVFGCSLPAWREPQALTMLSRDVRPLPNRPGVLQVHAEFRNDARWAQGMPQLLLTLADADGRRVGQRAFTPDEYLGTSSTTLIEPGKTQKISFNIREPASTAAAFEFNFR